jgi:hypothetical protein
MTTRSSGEVERRRLCVRKQASCAPSAHPGKFRHRDSSGRPTHVVAVPELMVAAARPRRTPRDCTTGVIRAFNRSRSICMTGSLADAHVKALTRTTSIARTISSSLISGPSPDFAPRMNVASCRWEILTLFCADIGSPSKVTILRSAPAPRLK